MHPPRMTAAALARSTLLCAMTGLTLAAQAQPSAGSDAELAKQLSNPIAALISLPLQLNWDDNIGPDRTGSRLTLNIQPVVPFSLNADWNLISRTILPVIRQDDVVPGAGSQSGVGDIVQSFFFSPKQPTASGWIWGVGPVFLLPVGSDRFTTDTWGVGPTAVALRQSGPMTIGVLANHIEGVGGSGPDLRQSFIQPFASYTTPTLWTYGINTEATYDWKREQWAAPLNLNVSKVVSVGSQKLSVGGGVGYWMTSPESGPHGWRFRLVVTFLFPK